MKVLVLSNYANGLVLFRKEVLQAFVKKGWETLVCVPMDENCSKISALGCRICPVELERRGMNPVKDLKLLFQYLKLLKREKPDVVLTYTIKPNLYGGLASRIRRVPYLMNITGLGTSLENPGVLGKILIQFYRFVTGGARCVFFQNSGNMEFMQKRKVALKNSCLLPGSGVNLKEHPREEYPSEREEIRFLAVLRVMKDKGVSEYLQAAEKIKKKYKNVSFCLVGEFEEDSREKYEPWLQELEENGTIYYMGHIDNVPEVMAESHVIVHPSYHEGLSNVLLEAAACARPVLASNVPGCRETLQDHVSGILFEPRSTESLVKAIEEMLDFTEKQRQQMGLEGRKYMETHFDRNLVIKIYLEEIAKALKI